MGLEFFELDHSSISNEDEANSLSTIKISDLMPTAIEEMADKYQILLVYEWMDKNEYFFEYKFHSGLKKFAESIFTKLE